MSHLRSDLRIIAGWIKPNSRVLDLGCGDGALLEHLCKTQQVSGYGLEINLDNITKCIQRGINVIQTDLDAGLSDFDKDSFDYVLMTQTLQAVHYPDHLLQEMLRIGREGIVTLPNFGHWKCRWQLMTGNMPVTQYLPHTWYDTPNFHLCTLHDFENLCQEKSIHILQRTVVDHTHEAGLMMRLFPHLMGEIALYRFRRG